MSIPNKKVIEPDFSSGAMEPRSPIIPMPIQTSAMEGVGGQDVLQMVDQLQQTAWEARSRLRAVEEERDALAQRFADAQRQAGEMRARLSESTVPSQDREMALKEARRYAQAANENQTRALAAEKQLPELRRQCDELMRQRDELNRKLIQLSRQPPAASEPNPQLLQIRQARDAAQATNRELTNRLAQADDEIAHWRDQAEQLAPAPARIVQLEAELAEARRTPPLPEPAEEVAAILQQRAEAMLQLEIVCKEVLGLRQQMKTLEASLAQAREEAAAKTSSLAELNASTQPLRDEKETARRNHEEALTSLAAAQKQIERIMRDRDDAREQGHQQALSLESELERLRAKTASQEKALAEAAQKTEALAQAEAERRELAERFEAQRVQTIDLATRLEAAQQEIREVSASLAEARLLAKSTAPRASAPEPSPEAPALAIAPAAFDTALGLEAIRTMRRCHHAFAKTPEDLSHLNELHCHLHTFAEQVRHSGFDALHRLVAAFDAFVQELYHFPEQISTKSLQTIPQAIEFFASLMKAKNLNKLRDSANATVYVVEDDPITSECITMAMETAMLRGLCATDPAKAACELAGTVCDLIFLDIAMPGMDGFELCAEIRGLALHRDTPIVFLTGEDTPEHRAQAARVGACDFLTKPFILCELTLKALMQMTKAQLRMA